MPSTYMPPEERAFYEMRDRDIYEMKMRDEQARIKQFAMQGSLLNSPSAYYGNGAGVAVQEKQVPVRMPPNKKVLLCK